MKLNIQLFASLNVGETYESSTTNIKPKGYNTNGYAMKTTVKLNSQSLANNSSNITITTWIKTLANTWGWYSHSAVRTERYTKVNSESSYTLQNTTPLTSLATNNANNWVNCGSWTGDVPHANDRTCTLYVKDHLYTAESSANYLPRDTAQETEAITLPQLHKSPEISINSITELNTYLTGVANDTFVQGLSKKQIAFTNTLYDSATVQGITIANGSTSASSTTSPITLDFTNKNLYTIANTIPIKATISDSYGSIGAQDINYTTTPIMYNKPAINTSTTVKRNGQLSGKALLNFTGTFYNGTIGSITNTFVIGYRIWEKGTTEPSGWTLIPDASMTISGNNVSVYNYEIGSTNPSDSNYFNFQKSYNVKIRIQDNMRTWQGSYMGDEILRTIQVGEPVWSEYKDRLKIKKVQVDTDIINPNLDLFNDTSGSDWKTMMKNKLDYCISNIQTSKENMETFINGGWSGINYGFGIFSKIGTTYQLVWHSTDGYKYVRKLNSTYSYYSSIPDTLYNNDTGIQSKSYASVSNLSDYKKLAITFTVYKNSDQANTGGTAHICWLDLTKKDGSGYARSGIVVPYSSAHLSSGNAQANDFKALFEADVNNNTVYCLFTYDGSVQTNAMYVMTKIEGYY